MQLLETYVWHKKSTLKAKADYIYFSAGIMEYIRDPYTHDIKPYDLASTHLQDIAHGKLFKIINAKGETHETRKG